MIFTNEDLIKRGVTHYDIDYVNDYREGTEYMRRLRAGLPTRAPRFQVGAWVYSYIRRKNLRVLFLEWDQGPPGHGSNWRLCVAGHGDVDDSFSCPRPEAPFIEVQCIGNCWAETYGPIAVCDLPAEVAS